MSSAALLAWILLGSLTSVYVALRLGLPTVLGFEAQFVGLLLVYVVGVVATAYEYAPGLGRTHLAGLGVPPAALGIPLALVVASIRPVRGPLLVLLLGAALWVRVTSREGSWSTSVAYVLSILGVAVVVGAFLGTQSAEAMAITPGPVDVSMNLDGYQASLFGVPMPILWLSRDAQASVGIHVVTALVGSAVVYYAND